MTSWNEGTPERKRREWLGLLALSLGVPVAFVGSFFLLSALLGAIARWIA